MARPVRDGSTSQLAPLTPGQPPAHWVADLSRAAPTGEEPLYQQGGLGLQLVVELYLEKLTELVNECADLLDLAPEFVRLEEIAPWTFVVPIDLEGATSYVQGVIGGPVRKQHLREAMSHVDHRRRDLLLEVGLGEPGVPPGRRLGEGPPTKEAQRSLQVSTHEDRAAAALAGPLLK